MVAKSLPKPPAVAENLRWAACLVVGEPGGNLDTAGRLRWFPYGSRGREGTGKGERIRIATARSAWNQLAGSAASAIGGRPLGGDQTERPFVGKRDHSRLLPNAYGDALFTGTSMALTAP